MKAIVSSRPGPVEKLAITEVASPSVPDDGVLVRVRASSANIADLFPATMAGRLLNRRSRELPLGTDFAGTVESVGKDVTEFRVGDEVFGGARGAFAELMCVPATGPIVHKPAGVTFEQAGTLGIAASTALEALRTHGRVQAGQQVLINGASGGVGTFAVQIACALGAEVTAVCSTRNVDMARALGARTVIDYTKEDFTRGGRRYDLVIDIAGSHSLRESRRVLQPKGSYVGVGVAAIQHGRGGMLRVMGHLLSGRAGAIGASQRIVSLYIAKLNKEDLSFLGELVASGRVTPAIEKRYTLSEAGAALSYLDEGHCRGKLPIRVSETP